jgi:dihydropteroate synthase
LSDNGKDVPVADRIFGTLGAEVALALRGAHIIRTHDVKSCVEALRLADVVAG